MPNTCPYCNNEQALKGYNTISDIYPELCDYWSSKNLLKSDEVTFCSFKKTAKGYNDLETTHPWLIKEWSTLNKQEMSSVRVNSIYIAWWKCPVCTGDYQQVIKEKFYRENSCPYCRNQKVLKGFNDLATTQQSLMHECDYLDNILIANPTEITELSNMSVWWICQENPEHRYKIQVKERMTYRKRNKKACSICKGYRRKQEHFVQFKKDIKK